MPLQSIHYSQDCQGAMRRITILMNNHVLRRCMHPIIKSRAKWQSLVCIGVNLLFGEGGHGDLHAERICLDLEMWEVDMLPKLVTAHQQYMDLCTPH